VQFLSAFGVPDVARPVIERIVDAEEMLLVDSLHAPEFSVAEAQSALEAHTVEAWSGARVRDLVGSAYRRGIIDIADERLGRYRVGTFYTRLEVFAVTQPDDYRALPAETIAALDAWCFGDYLKSLGSEPLPTSDRVTLLQETLDYIDGIDRPIWLNRCDCRTLAGECDQPTDTCISFRSGANTLSDRGWSKPLTKSEAKAIVSDAHERGLVQTVNDNGICNCCSDCCYLFRAQRARSSLGVWPLADKVAAFDSDVCIGCRACIKRCPFDVFALEDGQIVQRVELCRGCGLCADVCPTYAITMEPS
jgi:Pyruvate/2-oxoacid:ferredoxin oxidoreductase delta subunit